MRRLPILLCCLSIVGVAAGCSPDDDSESTSESVDVDLLAGGGDTEPDAEGVAGPDAQLDGTVTNMTTGADSSLWAVVNNDTIINIADGDVHAWTPALPNDTSAISDIATGPDDDTYLLLDGALSTVYEWEPDGDVHAVFGAQATPDQLSAPGPVSADGTTATDATLGEIVDLTVDADGRIVFAESLLPDGSGPIAASLVRTIDDNGNLATLAGQPWPEPETAPEPDQIQAAALPADHASPTDTDLLGPIALTTHGSDIYIRTGWSVLAVDNNDLSVMLGPVNGNEPVPDIDSAGPYATTTDATTAKYRAILDPIAFAANANGDILTGAIGNLDELDTDSQQPYLWDLADSSDTAQTIADARTTNADAHSTILATTDGDALTADLASTDATWLDDDTIALSTYDPETGQSIITTLNAEEPEG